MREMKDSGIEWIGEIPKEWKVSRHKYVMHKDKVICDNYDGQDIISLTMNGVVVRDLNAGGKMPTSFDGYQCVEPNDLLMCLFDIDVTPRCVGLVKNHGVTSPAYSRFKMHDGYFGAYYDYLLRFIDDEKVFVHLSKNLRSSLTESDFGSLSTIVPTLNEQKRIVSFLEQQCIELDNILFKTRFSIEEYKKLKQTVITKAVTEGLVSNAEKKESRIDWIGKIPRHWDLTKLKYLVDSPLQYGANESGVEYSDKLPRYIRITDITIDNKLKEDGKLSLEEEKAIPYLLFDDDILFSRSGATVGKTFLYKESYGKSAFAGYLIRASINRSMAIPKFVYYSTLSNNYDVWKESVVTQATIQNIGADKYSNYVLAIPPLKEQYEIIKYLDEKCATIDNLITKKEKYLEEIKNYKKSLIYEYVTGKKEVKNH